MKMFGKISHIIIVLLLLVSTTGFSISKHYCENHIVSLAINKSAETCNNPEDSCCQNFTVHIEVEDYFNFIQDISLPTPVSIGLLFTNFNFSFKVQDSFNRLNLVIGSFPIQKIDKQSLLQRYLL